MTCQLSYLRAASRCTASGGHKNDTVVCQHVAVDFTKIINELDLRAYMAHKSEKE